MSVPSLRGPALALAAVVLAAVLGAVALMVSWPEDPADRTAPGEGSSRLRVVEAQSESATVQAATAVLRAWSRPRLAYPWWWDGLEPLLSPGARAAYADTDPDKLPDLGELRPVEERQSATTATVWFTTEAGRFGVDLAQAAPDGEWRAHRILFPGQESMFG